MEILLSIMKIWCDKICMSRIIGDIVWTMNHIWFMKSVYVHFLLCSNSSSFLLFFSSSSQVFKFCHLHQAQNITFGHLFNQLLFLPLIFFLLLLLLVFWIDFFLWFERWHTFHHSCHFLYVHILAIIILLLASRLIGCIIFYSEFFPCWFWHLSSPCWCWHSPWCSWCSSSPCYYCCSSE